MNRRLLIFFARLIVAPIILLIIDQIIFRTGFYESHVWIDIPMHVAGGMIIAWGWMQLNEYLEIKQPKWLYFLTILGAVMLAATLWEFFEFVRDIMNKNNQLQPSIADTMFDYFNALVGASIVALYKLLRYN